MAIGNTSQEPVYLWERLSDPADLSNYYNKQETDSLLATKADANSIIIEVEELPEASAQTTNHVYSLTRDSKDKKTSDYKTEWYTIYDQTLSDISYPPYVIEAFPSLPWSANDRELQIAFAKKYIDDLCIARNIDSNAKESLYHHVEEYVDLYLTGYEIMYLDVQIIDSTHTQFWIGSSTIYGKYSAFSNGFNSPFTTENSYPRIGHIYTIYAESGYASTVSDVRIWDPNIESSTWPVGYQFPSRASYGYSGYNPDNRYTMCHGIVGTYKQQYVWERITQNLDNYYTQTEVDSLIADFITNTVDNLVNYYKKSETDDLLNNKVDKVEGKELSTNDFTDILKDKLDNIESEAQVNVIESISVEGIPQSIDDDKNVDIQLIRADLSTLESELVDIYNNSQPYENAEVAT